MKKIVLFTILLFSIAMARAEVVDLGSLQSGVEYDIPQFKGVKGEYTPSSTGPVRFIWTCNPLPLYSSATHDEDAYVDGNHTYNDGNQIVSYSSLDGGKTYYLYADFTIMGGKLKIEEGDTKIQFKSITPAVSQEYPFSVSSDYRIYVDFNFPVTIGNAFLLAGDERVQIYPILINNSVSCEIYSQVMDFYRRGVIKGGDKMTLRILQVKDALNPDNKYGDTGKFEIEIPMSAKPAELVESRNVDFKIGRNTLNSYYFANDEAAQVALIFDTAIEASKTPVADITYGNADNLDLGVYREQIAGTVEGNTVTFDFSGKLRRKTDMLPAATADELVEDLYVSFAGIFTPDGQRAYTGVMSNPNGFGASMTVNDLQYNIAADFSPARGASLVPGQEMEIWVMNGALIQYDNICIDYTANGETKTLIISSEAVTEKADNESPTGLDKLFYFTVPDYSADTNSDVYVYMSNLVCADGLDHSSDVRGNFKDSAASISEISAIKADKEIYDLSGRKVSRAARGIYIINGQKTLIK